MVAARWPPRSEPANSDDFRPRARLFVTHTDNIDFLAGLGRAQRTRVRTVAVAIVAISAATLLPKLALQTVVLAWVIVMALSFQAISKLALPQFVPFWVGATAACKLVTHYKWPHTFMRRMGEAYGQDDSSTSQKSCLYSRYCHFAYEF